ncbi:hypothetical protein IWQ56_004055, partial [Coemansia nantahalensis]
ARLAGSCHLRSFGVLVVDSDNEIVSADTEAVEALRGPQEEWDGREVSVLRDGSCRGTLHKYWAFIESLEVGGSDTGPGSGARHYLVIRRNDDDAVVWMQVCIHAMAADTGRPLFLWHVRDVSGAARCLEMSRLDADQDYELSLESDGLPHSRLLTQAPDARPSSDLRSRTQLADLLVGAVASEGFAVLHLTGFGAVDAVFPRRLLGWDEEDVLDRSFVGLLCPEDRAFFCGALRRCHHDGIPQRLVLKIASAAASDSRSGGEQHPQGYVACDVTVLLPESVQRPVLVVRANDDQWQRRVARPPAPPTLSARPLRHAVTRMQLDSVHVQELDSPRASVGCVRSGALRTAAEGAQACAARVHPAPPAALTGSSPETVFGWFSPVGSTFASILERVAVHTPPL